MFMKMLKKYMLLSFVGMIMCGAVNAAEMPVVTVNNNQLEALYEAYGQYGDDFVNHLPAGVSVEQCKQALGEIQLILKNQLDRLSYWDVLFSVDGAKKMGLMVGSIAGILAADWFMHHKLATVSSGIANDLANSMHEGHAFFSGGKVRLSQAGESFVRNKAYAMGIDIPGNDVRNLDDNVWNKIVDTMDKGLRNQQVIENMRGLAALRGDLRWYSEEPAESVLGQLVGNFTYVVGLTPYGKGDLAYSSYLTLHSIAIKALAVSAAVGGFGLYKDIKAMQDAKNRLSRSYDKCTKMIEMLEKAQ